MKKDEKTLYKFESLTDFHRVFGLQKPLHPLISFIDIASMKYKASELLLNYSNRFYKRQFITRKAAHNDLLQKLETILDDYFDNQKSLKQGIPTVQYLTDQLNLSASYLGDMMRALTGQNAQQHIHHKLVEKAKEQLSASNLSVAEIAYQLGFGHPQSFSRLFKTKTNFSPVEFRASFNS